MTDIEIARNSEVKPIHEIAKKINIEEKELEYFGKYKAKINLKNGNKNGKLILVTSINPTPAGEGKSTTTIGLIDALSAIDKDVIGCLREPSMGPVFGLKGGATGGGYSQVIPMEDINLHFTGDMHALTSANNLISSCLDNHIYQGNELEVDITKIVFKRVLDCNDRTLRKITIGQGSKFNGIERQDSFQITVASELMAILCLCTDFNDLKRRVAKIILAYNIHGDIVTIKDLNIQDAVCILLKEAIKPNLVQTLEHTPVLMHGGPFANIAHGCNSLIATKLGLSLADYVVTEAGFGADLGSEKFVDIKCRKGKLDLNCVVIVATIRALKYHGGAVELVEENIEALKNGFKNLEKHVETVKKYGVDFVISINKFDNDTSAEIDELTKLCESRKYRVVLSSGFKDGSKGCIDLAYEVTDICNNKNNFQYIYEESDAFETKMNKIVKNVYGGNTFTLSNDAIKDLEKIEKLGLGNLPICIAKTPASLSDDPKLIGKPEGFDINIRNINISNGAEFLVVLTGNVMTMPGLPKNPAAQNMSIDENMIIEGLF